MVEVRSTLIVYELVTRKKDDLLKIDQKIASNEGIIRRYPISSNQIKDIFARGENMTCT